MNTNLQNYMSLSYSLKDLYYFRSMKLWFLFPFLALVPFTALAEIALPPNDGFFTDAANLVPADQEELIENALQSIRDDTGNFIVVLFIEGIGREDAGVVARQVQSEWNLPSGNVLLLFSYNDRKIHIEPGIKFLSQISNKISQGITEKDILPQIRDGQYGTAVIDGIESILKHLSGEYTVERYKEPDRIGKSTFVIMLYAMVAIFALSWLFGTILVHTTTSKYSLAGTLIGPITGVLLLEKYGLWLAIPPFLIVGVLSDYLVFRMYSSSMGRGKGIKRKKSRR